MGRGFLQSETVPGTLEVRVVIPLQENLIRNERIAPGVTFTVVQTLLTFPKFENPIVSSLFVP